MLSLGTLVGLDVAADEDDVIPVDDAGLNLIPVSARLVYITHPGPDGEVHECQEVPY